MQSCEAAKQRKLHISHLKVAGEKNWSKLDAALNAIEQAASHGVNVTAAVTSSKVGDTTSGVYTQAGRLPAGSANQVVVPSRLVGMGWCCRHWY